MHIWFCAEALPSTLIHAYFTEPVAWSTALPFYDQGDYIARSNLESHSSVGICALSHPPCIRILSEQGQDRRTDQNDDTSADHDGSVVRRRIEFRWPLSAWSR